MKVWMIRIGREPEHSPYYLENLTFYTKKAALEFIKTNNRQHWYAVRMEEVK